MLTDDNQNSNSSSTDNTESGSSNNVPMRDTSEPQIRTGNTEGWITKRTQ